MKGKRINKNCNSCEAQLNTWDMRLSKTLAYKYPVCEKCIGREYDLEISELRNKMEHYYDIRPCIGI